jgi:hypothetical protein
LFYDEQDFRTLELVAQPRAWSNRLTVATILVALVILQIQHQLAPSDQTRAALRDFLLFLQEYGD